MSFLELVVETQQGEALAFRPHLLQMSTHPQRSTRKPGGIEIV